MGWYDAHLHAFDIDRFMLTDARTLAEVGEDGEDDAGVRLHQVFKREKQKIRYEYDFGDSWEHDVLLEKILPAEAGVQYSRCLKGRRACPPEDSGGPWGYEALLAALADKKHPEHEFYLEWIGEEFDPDGFDLEEINELLQGM